MCLCPMGFVSNIFFGTRRLGAKVCHRVGVVLGVSQLGQDVHVTMVNYSSKGPVRGGR